MIFLYLFYTFCKIGLFGFGGGYAMLSMIQGEGVTRYNWVSASEFTDIIAISQMTPGPVSYTHLDVYKRQGLQRSRSGQS